MQVRVSTVTTQGELRALETDWNHLAAGNPLMSWDWLATWWFTYGKIGERAGKSSRKQLRVLKVTSGEDGRVVGIAPFYLDRTLTKGNVLKLLGTGEVCTDHLTLLTADDHRSEVIAALAGHVTREMDDWDSVEMANVDEDDCSWVEFSQQLKSRACQVNKRPADSYWAIDLPDTWDDYLATQSKSHRKQNRRAASRLVESGVVHNVTNATELAEAWPILVDLHQRRRNSLGETGCFASRPFRQFHKEVTARLLERSQLSLSWLEWNGQPIAVDYNLASPVCTFAYQGGLDPDYLDNEPGRMLLIHSIQTAIARGHRRFDFMRGDEPYKAQWRATVHETCDYAIAPNRQLAKLRGRVLQVAGDVKNWMKGTVSAQPCF